MACRVRHHQLFRQKKLVQDKYAVHVFHSKHFESMINKTLCSLGLPYRKVTINVATGGKGKKSFIFFLDMIFFYHCQRIKKTINLVKIF